MNDYVILTDEKFLNLQKRVQRDLELTADNVRTKILELPIMYTRYMKLYLDQRKILKEIKNDMLKMRKKRYHHYKFDGDFALGNTTEINLYVDGDDKIWELTIVLDKQEAVVEYCKETVSQISKMSYLIKSYVELEKLRHGITN